MFACCIAQLNCMNSICHFVFFFCIIPYTALVDEHRVSADFNAPNKDEVFKFMDKAILDSGVNLIDTVSCWKA